MTARRRRRVLAAAIVGAIAAVALLAAVSLRPVAEDRVRTRLDSAARRLGANMTVGSVRVGLWPPLRLSDVRLEAPQWTVTVGEAEVRPRASLHEVGLRLGPASLAHRSGLAVDLSPSTWVVDVSGHAGRAVLTAPSDGFVVTWGADPDRRLALRAEGAAVGRVATFRRGAGPLLDAGVVDGTAELRRPIGGDAQFAVDLRARGLRVGALPDAWASGSLDPVYGDPSDCALRLAGTWSPADGRLDVPRFRVTAGGADLSGGVVLTDLAADPQVDLTLAVDRVDFARLFGSAGIEPPRALAFEPGAPGAHDLGAASLQASVRGHLRDARSFTVSQKLDFTPPRRPLPALVRLRGDFDTEVTTASGARRILQVSPESPDFVPLSEVPPLFVRTLLVAEDTSFFGHRGIDLSEIPPALITNWERGGVARGASTITQQLAKNLFLSRDKNVGRKLQELCLALLLEATLSKERMLEIYLNVIEWGPDLYGLRPAARRYFDKEPKDLTPHQMAFLVAIIPGPVKYQRSFADGSLSPGFRPLVDDLLAKVHSIGALSDEEYAQARDEALVVRPAEAAVSALASTAP